MYKKGIYFPSLLHLLMAKGVMVEREDCRGGEGKDRVRKGGKTHRRELVCDGEEEDEDGGCCVVYKVENKL